MLRKTIKFFTIACIKEAVSQMNEVNITYLSVAALNKAFPSMTTYFKLFYFRFSE
jgi:hypothetical protein